MIPERVRAWAQEQLGDRIVSIVPVGGGLTDTISAVHFADGDPVILRHVSIDRWGEVGRQHVISEALGCRLMADSRLPTPRLIATDPDGNETGAYVNLTTWLPGRVRLGHLGPAAIEALAQVAVIIHATPVAVAERPRPYAFWAPSDPQVPTWSSRPRLWQRAIETFAAGPPDARSGLLHRDFHPGNVLWRDDTITGVIDWAETSWGPADLDVAHSVTNFAMLHDEQSTAAFPLAYRRQGGVIDDDPEAARFWQLSDIVGFLPDPALQLAAIIAALPKLDAKIVRERLELLLDRTLG